MDPINSEVAPEVETPEQDVETTGEQDPAQTENQEESVTSASGEDTTASPKKGVQKRIDELTKQKHDEAREKEYWRGVALQAQQQPVQQPAPQAEPEVSEPRQDDYEDYDEYIDAKVVYKAGELFKQQQAEAEQARSLERQQQSQQTFLEKSQSFAAEHEDFQQVISNPSLPITGDMFEVIQASDIGPQIAYELGNNPGEAARIANLSPLLQARELTLMEARLTAKPAPKQSSAPDPIKPLGGNQPPVTDPDKMPIEEWVKWRNKQAKVT